MNAQWARRWGRGQESSCLASPMTKWISPRLWGWPRNKRVRMQRPKKNNTPMMLHKRYMAKKWSSLSAMLRSLIHMNLLKKSIYRKSKTNNKTHKTTKTCPQGPLTSMSSKTVRQRRMYLILTRWCKLLMTLRRFYRHLKKFKFKSRMISSYRLFKKIQMKAP